MTTQTQQAQHAWDNLASAYDTRVTDHNFQLAEEMLSRIDLRPGTRFLDVACGSGALSIPAAQRGADVVAVDISPEMIQLLMARVRAKGIAHIEGKVMDGLALQLEDDAFDSAGSLLGVMVFPDVQRGLTEMARVTKPGGKVLVAAFGPLPKVERIGYCMQAVQAAVPGAFNPPKDRPLPPFQMADPARMHDVMEAAGLNDVQVDPIIHRAAFDSAEQLWHTALSGHPIGHQIITSLTAEQTQAALGELDKLLQQRIENGEAITHNTINIGVGTA